MLHLYHDVPPCPNCGSTQTGYYLFQDIYRRQETTRAVNRGELVAIKPVRDYGNCFCNECGRDFHGDIELRLITGKEVKRQKQLRGITDDDVYQAGAFFRASQADYLREKRNKNKIYTKTKETAKKLFGDMF